MTGARRGDAGFTLTELLMVIMLMGIIGAVIATAVTTGLQKQRQVQDRNDAMAQMRMALQRVDRDIRSSAYISSATATSISLEEDQPSSSRCMTYWTVSDGSAYDLMVKNTAAACTSSSGSSTSGTLLRNLTSSSLFTYSPRSSYSVAGVGADCYAASLAGYDTACIGTVTVTLNDQPPALSKPVLLSDGGTELRNAS